MDYIACPVEFAGHNLNGFTPNSNLTGHKLLVKLGVNPLRSKAFKRQWITLHAWSNLVVIISMDLHPIQIRPVEFDQALITGQIG